MRYGYCRVSTKGQARDGNSLAAQEAKLKEYGAEEIYCDSVTGTKMSRPAFDQLKAKLKTGDTLMVCKLDRLARSAAEGAQFVNELIEKGVTVHILNMGLMDDSPTGKLITNILFAFAEFERDMIVERTQSGKAIAKMNPNFKDGRPPKYQPEQIEHALDLLDSKKLTYKEVEKKTGISKSTLIRARRKKASEEVLKG